MDSVLIRGSGDIGSAVAQRLHIAGFLVVLHDTPQPTTTRRKMAFTDAIFDGHCFLEGLEARRLDDLDQLKTSLPARTFIPLLVCDFSGLLNYLRPRILVDARMRKHFEPENQINLADLTIGLGPNFIAGVNVHLGIETGRGENLGKVIRFGSTQPLEGEPIDLAGHGRDRYIYAAMDGIFHTALQVGDPVSTGQLVANLGGTQLRAPLDGLLRGLTHDGVPVIMGTKVIEIDPRGAGAQINGIASRPACIAQGVLDAITQ
jgi:xanthine dehydrogenase accessory factor